MPIISVLKPCNAALKTCKKLSILIIDADISSEDFSIWLKYGLYKKEEKIVLLSLKPISNIVFDKRIFNITLVIKLSSMNKIRVIVTKLTIEVPKNKLAFSK